MAHRKAYLGIGANMGDRRRNLREAVRALGQSGQCDVVAVSSLYETEPVGVVDQPAFLNAVVEVSTSLSPRGLLELAASTEQNMGRKRTRKWGPRVLDIDILVYEGLQVSDVDLRVPHPRILEREFVLRPLAEIAPNLVVEDGSTAAQAAGRVRGQGVARISGPEWID